jgi:hypothetical protein
MIRAILTDILALLSIFGAAWCFALIGYGVTG